MCVSIQQEFINIKKYMQRYQTKQHIQNLQKNKKTDLIRIENQTNTL